MRGCFAAGLLLVTACETPISLEIPGNTPTTVIEGWIVNGRTARVIVSRSLSYYSDMNMDSLSSAVDDQAIVIVSDDMGNSEQLVSGYHVSDLGEWGSFLGLTGKGFYGRKIRGEPGHTYYLHVETGGKTYSAQTTIALNTVQVDTLMAVFRDENDPNDTLGSLRVYWTDDGATYDNYRFFVKIRDLDPFYHSVFTGCFDDLLFNGQTIAFEMLREPWSNLPLTGMSQQQRDDYYRRFYKKGETVYVRSTLTDKATQEYWFELQTALSLGMTPFLEPSSYKSNITGERVTGIWSGYHARYDTITFPE